MLGLSSAPKQALDPPRYWRPVSASEGVAHIRDGFTLAVSWMGDSTARALATGFAANGRPSGLTVVYATTRRGMGRAHGLNILAREGLVRRVIGGQWYPVAGFQALAAANRIEAYSLPAGRIIRLIHDIADGLPAHLSRVGLGTFADPRHGGGRLNRITREEMVHLINQTGEEALLYRGFPIDAAVVGATFLADGGGLAMTREGHIMARAAHRDGGIVIAQIDRIGTVARPPRGYERVPDTLVDVLVQAEPPGRRHEVFVSAV